MNYQILEHQINEANKLDIQYSLLDKELQESVVVEDESLYERFFQIYQTVQKKLKDILIDPMKKVLNIN